MSNLSKTAKQELCAATSNGEGYVLNETGTCVLCGEKTSCKCDRCGDFYCSEFCQKRDWQSHRYICFPMPKLIKAGPCTSVKKDAVREESQAKTEPTTANSSMPPNGSCVILTGFKSSNRCYIRSTNPSIVTEYQRVLNEINEFGKNSSPLNENPRSNSYALAMRGEKWWRVTILGNRRGDGYYRILFMDTGDVGNVLVREMRKITSSIVNLPCYTHMVQLDGVKNYSTEMKVLQSLEQYSNKEYRVEFVGGGTVKLFVWGSNKLINPLIVAAIAKHDDKHVSAASTVQNGNGIQQAVLEKPSVNGSCNKKDSENKSPTVEKSKVKTDATDNLSTTSSCTRKDKLAAIPRQIQIPCLQPPFEIIPLNETIRDSKILIVDDSYIETGFIGCVLEKYVENLNNVTKLLSDYEVSDQPYKPKFNEYCLAKYENEWYRGKVVEVISEDNFLVVYIDFTNEKELTSNSIRRYPMTLKLPCCTTLCGIQGLPDEIPDEMKTFLNENCKAFSHLNIDGVRIIDNVPYIESKELLNKLRDLKLL